ncbi:MAG: 50S ribosomal protein L6 [Arsenophonus endosymbiont of Ceratovacuna japonica]
MSRVAKLPIIIPTNVEIKLNGQDITIKSKNSKLFRKIHKSVKVKYIDNKLIFIPRLGFVDSWMQAGTTRSLLNAMVIGVTQGFTKKLNLIGVGYRVSIKDNIISLFLGFSHTIEYILPKSIFAKCPSQTEIVLEGSDKQLIGQVAAKLRAYRPPEPYKGKGIHYAGEIVRTKEAKKK